MARTKREFDLVLLGATGFTGRLVAEYLAENASDDLRWALAGRNLDRLEQVRQALGPDFEQLPLIEANCFDRESLDRMVARTGVVCTTVGPYAKYGSELVAACVEGGADYCDLTGEAHWIFQMLEAHEKTAQSNGVRIVHCCGFDSIPSDLGTYFLQSQALEKFGAPCSQVELYVMRLRGAVSGGTAESMVGAVEAATNDRKQARVLLSPYGLNPAGDRVGPSKTQQGVRFDKELNAWTAPFIMAAVNEKIVNRSNALRDFPYGRDFRYRESSVMGTGPGAAVKAGAMTAGLGAFAAGLAIKPTRALLQRFVLPEPGQGPDKEARDKGCFLLKLVGRGEGRDQRSFEIAVEVEGHKDPGYGATAIMLAEAACCLAEDDQPENTLSAGFLTPATAMGDALISRLNRQGIEFRLA